MLTSIKYIQKSFYKFIRLLIINTIKTISLCRTHVILSNSSYATPFNAFAEALPKCFETFLRWFEALL